MGESDEISLIEIIQIIFKRKWLIVLCISFAILITFCYLLFKKPISESKAAIQVGYNTAIQVDYNGEKISNKVQSIEDPLSLAWVLKNTEKLSSVKVEKMG